MKKRWAGIISAVAGICIIGVVISGCSSNKIVREGDTVQVDYTLTLNDGTMVETTVGNEPLEMVPGDGNFLPDFEEAIVGMKVGESKTITIPAEDAYGVHNDVLVFSVNRTQLQEGLDPKVGDYLQSMDENGQTSVFLVVEVSDSAITIDANSPLAGEDLTFKIDLLSIN